MKAHISSFAQGCDTAMAQGVGNSGSAVDVFEQMLPSSVRFYTVAGLAGLLGVSKQHIINLVDSGELSAGVDLRTSGKRRACMRIPRASVVAFLNRRSA